MRGKIDGSDLGTAADRDPQSSPRKNLESPARSDTVKRVMQGIRRTLSTKQRQVRPMVKDDLLAALVMIDQQKKPVKAGGIVPCCSSALRRPCADRSLWLCEWSIWDHLSNGVEIFLPSSKTDQEGLGRTVFIPWPMETVALVRALELWLEITGINEGFVFRAVSRHDRVARHGLSAQSVALVVKTSVERLGGDAKKSAATVCGPATARAQVGLQPWQIREQTGHKSDVTLAKYIRPVARRKSASALRA